MPVVENCLVCGKLIGNWRLGGGRGLCHNHYIQWHRGNKLLPILPPLSRKESSKLGVASRHTITYPPSKIPNPFSLPKFIDLPASMLISKGLIYQLHFKGILQYLGRTTDIFNRLTKHKLTGIIFDGVTFSIIEDEFLREVWEVFLIWKLQPVYGLGRNGSVYGHTSDEDVWKAIERRRWYNKLYRSRTDEDN